MLPMIKKIPFAFKLNRILPIMLTIFLLFWNILFYFWAQSYFVWFDNDRKSYLSEWGSFSFQFNHIILINTTLDKKKYSTYNFQLKFRYHFSPFQTFLMNALKLFYLACISDYILWFHYVSGFHLFFVRSLLRTKHLKV